VAGPLLACFLVFAAGCGKSQQDKPPSAADRLQETLREIEALKEEVSKTERSQQRSPEQVLEDSLTQFGMDSHRQAVKSLAFSPDGKWLVSASEFPSSTVGSDTIKLWEVASRGVGYALEPGGDAPVAFSPDGNAFASASDTPGHDVILWDLASRKPARRLPNAAGYALAFSPDGKTLASDNRLFDVASGKQKAAFSGIEWQPAATCVAFSPGGKSLALGWCNASLQDFSGGLKLFDVTSGKELVLSPGYAFQVESVAFSQDGSILAAGGIDGVRLWDLPAGKEKARFLTDEDRTSARVSSIAFSPDGKTLAYATGDTVYLWDVAAQTVKAKLEGHTGAVNCVAISPDGNVLASGGADKTIKFWGLPGGRRLKR
jgi:WD40 repeat protein